MTTTSTPSAGEFPPLPTLDPMQVLPYSAIRYVNGYPESYVKQYAQAYAALALRAQAAEGEQSAAHAAGQEEHSLSWCDLEYAERTLQWIADRKMVMGDGTIERIDDIRSAARVAKEAHRRIARALPILAATPAPAHPLPVAGDKQSAPLLMQDENSGRDGRRYNEWHASRPDARLNAREAAAQAGEKGDAK